MMLKVNSKYPGVAAGQNAQLAICDSCLSHVLANQDLFLFDEKITGLQVRANDRQQQLYSEVEAEQVICVWT